MSTTVIRAVARAAALAAAAALPSALVAQGGSDADVPPLYQVEVIVFAYNDADPNEERFRPRTVAAPGRMPAAGPQLDAFDFAPLMAEDLAERLATAAAEAAAAEAEAAAAEAAAAEAAAAEAAAAAGTTPTSNEAGPVQQDAGASGDAADQSTAAAEVEADQPFRFRLVGREALQMVREYGRLQSVDAYTPLLHGAWIQQGLPENQAQPFDLTYLGTLNPLGTVRLHVSRFLHVTLDLEYRPTTLQTARLPSPQAGGFGVSELSLGPRIPLEVSRRIRSGEIHYFDHPYFGVLVMVTPYEPEPEGETEEGPAA